MKLVIVTLLILASVALGYADAKYVINSKRLSTREVAISCNNGGDPTGQKIGDTADHLVREVTAR